MGVGLMGGSLLCAHKIQIGEQTVGDFVLFVSYIDQLYGSLNLLGMHYRSAVTQFLTNATDWKITFYSFFLICLKKKSSFIYSVF